MVKSGGKAAEASGASSVAAAGARASKQRRTEGMPKQLDLNSSKRFLPTAACTLWESATDKRVRCFYSTPDGKRLSHGQSLLAGDVHSICVALLKWCWARHKEHTGAECPYEAFRG